MASKLDELKTDSAKDYAEYRQQHQKYQSEISALTKNGNEKQENFHSLSQEFKSMNREDDPKAFDEKEAEVKEAENNFSSSQEVLKEKQTEFSQYQKDNPSYNGLMQKEGELKEVRDEFKSKYGEIENASNETFAKDYQDREGRTFDAPTMSGYEQAGDKAESTTPNNSKLAELAEQAKKDPQIENTSKTIENTKGNDSLDGGDDFER